MILDDFPWLQSPLREALRVRSTLAHALLVHGPPAIGKSAFGMALAQSLLCEAPLPDGLACQRCEACAWFAAGNHPDFRKLAPVETEERSARDIRVEQVRALADFVTIGAHRGGARVILVDPAEAMNAIAANALLKTLEEPTPGVHFVLVANRLDALPVTVRSRAVRVPLAGPTAAEALRWLQRRTGADAETAGKWLMNAGGAPLRAESFAEPEHATAHRLVVDAVAGLPETGVVEAAQALAGVPARTWVPVMQTWLADLARVKAGAAARWHADAARRLEQLASRASAERVVGLDRWLASVRATVDHPLNARLLCEDAATRLAEVFETRVR